MIYDGANAPIKLGDAYGYSINHNGSWHSVIGIADAINENGKITLRSCYEANGSNGKIGKFRVVERKRSIYGCACFHISMDDYHSAKKASV